MAGIFSFLCLAPIVHAAYTIDDAVDKPEGKKFLDVTANAKTGINTSQDITAVIKIVFKAILGATGFAFFILMIYGGYIWMSSQGNEELVTKGRNTVIAAGIGLAIIVGGYAVSVFVAGALTK